MADGRGPLVDVVRFGTQDGQHFYARLHETKEVERVVYHNGNVREVEIIKMSESEYEAIPATSSSVAFFSAEHS
jgi:hypothetical protein